MRCWEVVVAAGMLILTATGCSNLVGVADATAKTVEGPHGPNVYMPLPASSAATDSEIAATRPFDEAEARAKLAQVDIEKCTGPHVEARARLYYRTDGQLAALVIDESTALEPKRVRCMGEKLARVTVPPFRGGPAAFGMYLQL